VPLAVKADAVGGREGGEQVPAEVVSRAGEAAPTGQDEPRARSAGGVLVAGGLIVDLAIGSGVPTHATASL
jgi:hypothetical protein